jgi:Anti-sigma-K factor rskA
MAAEIRTIREPDTDEASRPRIKAAMNDEERYADYLEGGTLDDTLDDAARAELDELRRLLAAASTWDEPPPQLADGIVAEIRAEVVEARPAEAPTRRSRTWTRPVLTVAAAAAAVFAVAVGAVLVTRDGDDGESFTLAATDVIPDASAGATVESTGSGLAISLNVDGLPPAEPGTFYQAWMRGDTGSVPIGTFHARQGDGPIELWSGVDVADYPTMTVTVQQEGAGPESSGIVVLRGEIPQP